MSAAKWTFNDGHAAAPIDVLLAAIAASALPFPAHVRGQRVFYYVEDVIMNRHMLTAIAACGDAPRCHINFDSSGWHYRRRAAWQCAGDWWDL